MMLPTEILDIVFSEIHNKTSAPTSESQATFSSLCLASKHFLPLAREYLYYRPIRFEAILLENAVCLVNSLNMNEGGLGKLVKSLEGVGHCLVEFAKSTTLLFPQLPEDGQEPGEEAVWYLDILRACPLLVDVEICWDATGTPREVERVLRPVTATLRTVRFCQIAWSMWYNRITIDKAAEMLKRSALRNVETVKLRDLDYSSDVDTCITHPLQALHIEVQSRFANQMIGRLRLDDLSRFHTLHISGETHNLDGLPDLILSLALALQHYKFVPNVPPPDCMSPQYARLYLIVPDLAMFRDLANLTSITINNSRGCFLDLLATLSSSSPLLELVDFHGSHWIQRNDASLRRGGTKSFEERYVPACSKSEVETLLQGFKSLRRIDLGVLPTTHPDDYEGLGNDLKGKGVTIVWDHFRVDEPCLKCGAVHE